MVMEVLGQYQVYPIQKLVGETKKARHYPNPKPALSQKFCQIFQISVNILANYFRYLFSSHERRGVNPIQKLILPNPTQVICVLGPTKIIV